MSTPSFKTEDFVYVSIPYGGPSSEVKAALELIGGYVIDAAEIFAHSTSKDLALLDFLRANRKWDQYRVAYTAVKKRVLASMSTLDSTKYHFVCFIVNSSSDVAGLGATRFISVIPSLSDAIRQVVDLNVSLDVPDSGTEADKEAAHEAMATEAASIALTNYMTDFNLGRTDDLVSRFKTKMVPLGITEVGFLRWGAISRDINAFLWAAPDVKTHLVATAYVLWGLFSDLGLVPADSPVIGILQNLLSDLQVEAFDELVAYSEDLSGPQSSSEAFVVASTKGE